MGGFCGLGAFSRYATVARGSVVPIPSDIPLDLACLLACCVPTGWGSAVNAARITPGDVVTIIGVGGVGSFAVQGALAAGASVVACIDPEPFKLQFAAKLGAHLCYQSYDEAAAALAEETAGVMADKVIVTVGNVTADAVAQGFALDPQGRDPRGDGHVARPAGGDGQAAGHDHERLGQDGRRRPLRVVQPAPRHPDAGRPLASWSAQPG